MLPWLRREVNVLLDYSDECSKVVDKIISLVSTHFIRSQEFKVAIGSYFGNKTEHFIHEFYMFAGSFCDVYGFDEHAYYFVNVKFYDNNRNMAWNDNRENDSTTKIEALKVNYYMYFQNTLKSDHKRFQTSLES